MNTYYYYDNSKKKFENGNWINVCISIYHANSILEADKNFQEKLGYDPAKNKFIGCEIIVDEIKS